MKIKLDTKSWQIHIFIATHIVCSAVLKLYENTTVSINVGNSSRAFWTRRCKAASKATGTKQRCAYLRDLVSEYSASCSKYKCNYGTASTLQEFFLTSTVIKGCGVQVLDLPSSNLDYSILSNNRPCVGAVKWVRITTHYVLRPIRKTSKSSDV